MNDLAEFHAFIGSQLQTGEADISPEEALEMWRDQCAAKAGDDATDDLREALDDMAAGDAGLPFEEFNREFRRQNQIP
jgi:hypothetical protein